MYTKLILFLMLLSIFGFAQQKQKTPETGSICGKVVDASTSELLPFVNIALYKDSDLVTSTTTDLDGLYCFKKLANGTYQLVFTYIGYSKVEVKSIKLVGRP